MAMQERSSKRRRYRMGRRGERVERTSQRITEAAVRLHTTVGPSETSMSAVAGAAGVTRVTLYRHFATKDDLFVACMTHWRALHPPPDPVRWGEIPTFDRRVRRAIGELYEWYAANNGDLYPIYRDAAFTPASNQRARAAANERMADAILVDAPAGGAGHRAVRAALGHVLRFWTWRSLELDEGLSTTDAAD